MVFILSAPEKQVTLESLTHTDMEFVRSSLQDYISLWLDGSYLLCGEGFLLVQVSLWAEAFCAIEHNQTGLFRTIQGLGKGIFKS